MIPYNQIKSSIEKIIQKLIKVYAVEKVAMVRSYILTTYLLPYRINHKHNEKI